MKIEEIKTIVKLMSENDLTEFKIEAEDMHLCIRRGSQQTAAMAPQAVMAAPAVVPATPAAPAPAAAPVPAPAASAPAAAPVDAGKIIESPIVGTFYRSSYLLRGPFARQRSFCQGRRQGERKQCRLYP